MKKTFKKSSVFFMALAVFAMVLIGCSKNDSASTSTNSGNGNDPTPPATSNTMTIDNQSYGIAIAGWYIDVDDETGEKTLAIAFADAMTEDPRLFGIGFPDLETIPTGTFQYNITNPTSSNPAGFYTYEDDFYVCNSGAVSISKSGNNYVITSQGTMTDMASKTKSFSINFNGEITHVTD